MRKQILVIFSIIALLGSCATTSTNNIATREAQARAQEFLELGNQLFDQGIYNQAIANYTEAIKLDPNFAVAFNNRGISYSRLGDNNRAIADLTEAIRLEPTAGRLNSRGLSYHERNNSGDIGRAISDFEAALRMDPNNTDIRENLDNARQGRLPRPNRYRVTFNANGGSGQVPSQQRVSGGSSTTLPGQGNLSRSGYTFGGWNTRSDGTGANFSTGSNITITSEITLFARWISTQSQPTPSFTITSMDFANTDKNGNVIGSYGTSFEGTAVRYIIPRITYDYTGPTSINRVISIKIINPDGSLRTHAGSPAGFSVDDTFNVKPNSRGERLLLTGLGSESGGSYSAGTYTCEIWSNGQRLYSARFTVVATREIIITYDGPQGSRVRMFQNNLLIQTLAPGNTLNKTLPIGSYTFEVQIEDTGSTSNNQQRTPYTVNVSNNSRYIDIFARRMPSGIVIIRDVSIR